MSRQPINKTRTLSDTDPLRQQIHDLLGYCNYVHLHSSDSSDKPYLILELDDCTPEFDKLVKLSNLLQTAKLDFWSHEAGGCPTCGSGVVTEITIREIPEEVLSKYAQTS